MEIAICDDNRIFAHNLRELTVNYFRKIDRTCHCSIFLTPESLLNADLSLTNVLFLDIEMPHINGLDVAGQLRKLYTELLIVFVTSWIEYAPAGYSVNAFRYLLKQHLSDELSQCLNDICQKVFQTHEYIELTGKNCSGGSVGMGKCAEASNRTEISPGQGAALSSGAVALSGALSGGRQAGALQQPRRAQHKALCDGAEEFSVLQHTGRGPEQCSPLQSD